MDDRERDVCYFNFYETKNRVRKWKRGKVTPQNKRTPQQTVHPDKSKERKENQEDTFWNMTC